MTGKLREEPHRYNNQAQQIIYTIIERLTGKSFERCVREAIFDPLGMASTGFSAADAGEDFASGYRAVHTPTGMREGLMPVVYGLDNQGEQMGMAAGRIISTVEDLVRVPASFQELFSEALVDRPGQAAGISPARPSLANTVPATERLFSKRCKGKHCGPRGAWDRLDIHQHGGLPDGRALWGGGRSQVAPDAHTGTALRLSCADQLHRGT